MLSQSFILLKNNKENFSNMALEETLDWVEKFSNQLADEIKLLKRYEQEYPEEVENLLNERTFERYKGTAFSLRVPYEKYKELPDSDSHSKHILEQGLLVQSWSTLGSHLESTLQMFLSFYYRFYVISKWNIWEEKAIDQISEVLTGSFKNTLNTIIENNNTGEGLTNEIKKSFINKAKDILKSKRNLPKIERITLSDLIAFYFDKGVVEGNEYSQEDFDKIRDYRNAIHAFQERTIGSWEDYNNYIKTVITLIIDMLYRLPEIEFDGPIPEWYYDRKSELIMQENEWFDYQLGFPTE